MAVCVTCGTETDQVFTVTWEGRSATFDCIECLATMVAPICGHCGCRILGHSLLIDGHPYCCPHCAQSAQWEGPVGPDSWTGGRWHFDNTSHGARYPGQ
ncbi:hypothetical protein ABIA30_001148 [Mycobacterium sp. MAA66]|uniref:hypothetical protein n=1 Tax=Mycobacterium sp. MAA66 TaxID=3156297 RepID=UPI003519909B